MNKCKIKLVCFDLNKTLIRENTWFNLNLAMGISRKEDELLLKLFDEGIISYKQWQEILSLMYKKRGRANLRNITKAISKYTYRKEAKSMVKYLKKKGYQIALISGAMDILVDKVAKELEVGLFEAGNIFIFDNKDYLENIVCLGEEALVKLRHLQSFCRELGIKLSECACIGDGDNEIELFKKTKHGVTFKGSELESIAWKTIEQLSDLKKIF